MIALFLATLAAFASKPPPENPVVRSAYDGDTLTLETGDKVRLSWVNTPELRPLEAFGPEARDLTRQLTVGREVKLLLQGTNPRDGYGRLLAGIYVDGQNLSLRLIEEGLGHLFVIPPEAYDMQPLVEAQARARAARKGIWSTDHYQGAMHITSFHANAPGDDRENVNGEYLRVCNVTEAPVNVAGWRIGNERGQTYTLPDLTIPAGHTVMLLSGHGAHQADPARQLAIHLGSDEPIWDNARDKAVITDKFGKIVDWREHVAKGTPSP